MKPLRVEFVRPSSPGRWAWLSLAGLGALALAAAIAAWTEHYQYQELERRLAVARAEAERASAAAQDAEAARRAAGPPPYYESALQALKEAQTPIPEMLTSLESVATEGVTVRSVEMWSAERTARIEVEFRDYAALLQHLTLLNEGEPVQRWRLRSAQLDPLAAQGAGGAATIEGDWRP